VEVHDGSGQRKAAAGTAVRQAAAVAPHLATPRLGTSSVAVAVASAAPEVAVDPDLE
jgi:hypothetical protein